MRRLLLALITFLLASVVVLPAPAGAVPGQPSVNIDNVTGTTVTASWSATDGGSPPVTYEASISPDDGAGAGFIAAGSAATSTTFTGLTPGVEYTVTVVASNIDGDSTPGTATATTIVAPSNVAVAIGTETDTTVPVSWSSDGDTATYTVSISPDDGGGAGALTNSAATSTTFTGLNPETSYVVTVVATNAAGSDSGTGNATTDAAPVVPPTNVIVTIGTETETAIPVSWSSAGDPATYTVSIAPNDADGGALTDSTATTTTFTGLNPGTNYTVTVQAENDGGSSSGIGVGATEVAAPVITTLNVTANGSSGVNVNWVASAGGGTNSYTTAISPNDGSGGVTGSAATSTSYTGLNPGQSYTVTLTATNAGGTDTDSGSATTALGASGAPTAVVASLSGLNDVDVTVAWQAPANTGGGALGAYTIRLSNGETETAPGSATSVTFTGIDPGTTVTATVQSSNGAGAPGGTSASSNSVTTSDVPDPVSGLSAEWAGAENINAIDVSWSAPGDTGGLALTGYVVEVSPAIGNPIPVVAPGQTSLTIGGLEQGTSYTVTVRAQNARGNSASRSSGAVLVPDTPGTVTNLVVQQSPPFSSSVVLTWDLPTDDGGAPISGYSIVVDDREPLIVGPDVVTASFSGLPVGDHNVTVRAITAAGLGATATSPNFEVKAFPPFDTEEQFVTQLYADFLRRAPDAGGLAFWTARVNDDGSNVQDIVEAFMRSPEFSPRRAVARLYFAYFNRQPDKSGFDFWTRQISTGAANLENASQSFALSAEFERTYGDLNDAEFIVLVYNNVLGRRPDQGGFGFWLDQLANGLPRGTLMTLFSESPENVERSRAAVDVTVTYDGLLQRAPDVEGFLFWTGRVADTNEGLTELIRQFYFSPEFAGRVTG